MAAALVVEGIRYRMSDLPAWETGDALAGGLPSVVTEQAVDVSRFCRDWLSGVGEFVVQTSGSTGAPKPIVLTRAQMEASANATGAALGLNAGDRALVCLATRYIAGRMMLVRGLVLNLEMVVVAPAADPLIGFASDERFDFAAFVPLQLQTLLDTALTADSDSCFPEDTARAYRYRRILDGMKAILVGGGPVSPTLEAAIRRLAAPVYHTYGMTETATHVALRRLNGLGASTAFRPLPGVALRVDDRVCLAICAPMTADVWIQTNDVVDLQADGSFVWLGRWDNVINSGGVKVSVEAVEKVIEQVAADQRELGLVQRRLFVAGLTHERLGQEVVLIVEGGALSADQEEQLHWTLGQALERYHAPRRILYYPHFPVLPTGKIDRRTIIAGVA